MHRPTQTDRLEAGHIATFACGGKEFRYRVSDRNDLSTRPETHDLTSWLKPFDGQSVGFSAEIWEPEDNRATYTLVKIELDDAHAILA